MGRSRPHTGGVEPMGIALKIRLMEKHDVNTASAICMASFTASVAGTLAEEGVSTFSKIAAADALLDRMQADSLLLVAECDGHIRGVVELREDRHIAMLFVEPAYQRQGIGRKLLAAALDRARAETVTVRASLSSVPAYEKYGFTCTGDVSESVGLVYQSMEIDLDKARLVEAAKPRR